MTFLTKIKANTASTSTTTGAFVVAGGIGIGGDVNIGGSETTAGNETTLGNEYISGISNILNTTDSTLTTNGALVVSGGIGVAKTLNVGGIIYAKSGIGSNDVATGSLVVTGGVGISGSLNLIGNITSSSGFIRSSSGIASTSTSTGALQSTGGLGVAGAAYIGGITNITNATASSSTTTGAMVVTGGAGIGGSVYIGSSTPSTSTTTGALVLNSGGIGAFGGLTCGGVIKTTATTVSTSTGTGAIVSGGGLGVAGAAYIGGITNITNTTVSTTPSSGALVVSGGVGIAGTLNTSGAIKTTMTTPSVSSTTGALIVSGGAGIGGAVYIGDNTPANSTTIGALVLNGGIGAFGGLTCGGVIKTSATTVSTDTNTGALTVVGGVGIGGTVNIGGISKILNTTTATGTDSGALIVSGGVGIKDNLHVENSSVFYGGVAVGEDISVSRYGIFGQGIFVYGQSQINDNTQSDTTTTGSLITSGGVGIVKKLNVGGDIKTLASLTVDVGVSIGAGLSAGGGGVFGGAIQTGGTIDSTGRIKVNDTTTSTSTGTGSIITSGGIGVADTIHTGVPIGTDSGGTGLSNIYSTGDILVANDANSFQNLSIGTSGEFLMTDPTAPAGVSWSYGLLENFINAAEPRYISTTQFSIHHGYAVNNAKTRIIRMNSPITVSLSNTGFNGIISNNTTLNGTIYYNNITGAVIGTGTTFTSDFKPGDVIRLNNNDQRRRIINIISDTSLLVTPGFSGPLNSWIRGGTSTMSTVQFKFGAASLRPAIAGDYATCVIGTVNGNTTPTNWTIECWVYITTATAAGVFYSNTGSFALRLAYSGTRFTISLGNNGISYNIANATNFTGTTGINTWAHVAVSFNGAAYRCFLNGSLTNGATITTTAVLASTTFNAFSFGTNGTTTLPCYIDELRISNIARYTAAFTVATSAFTVDANCLVLNHFDGPTGSFDFSQHDNTISNKALTFTRGGLAPGTHYYIYLIGDESTSGVILSTRCQSIGEQVVDLPIGYTADDIRQTPYNITTDASSNLVYTLWSGLTASIQNSVVDSTISSSTISTFYLSDAIPKSAAFAHIVCNLTNKDTTNSVIIGPNSTIGYSTICSTSTNGNIIQGFTSMLDTNQTIDARISTVTLTSTATITIDRYYVSMPY